MEFPGLLFSLGLANQDLVSRKFSSEVTHAVLDRASFFLAAAFGRCKFRLFEALVGILLQAAIGGSAQHFFVS